MPEQLSGKANEFVRILACSLQQPPKHPVGQQANIIGEQTKHKSIDEMRYHL